MGQGIDPHLLRGLHELFGLPVDDLAPGSDLEADLLLDSLAQAELRVWLEDVTGASVMLTDDSPAPRTLADLEGLLVPPPTAATPEDLT